MLVDSASELDVAYGEGPSEKIDFVYPAKDADGLSSLVALSVISNGHQHPTLFTLCS